jgi:ankyrin repeat protein
MLNFFDLLKERKYPEFTKQIKEHKNDKNFDINLRDDNDNYYITYAILLNNITIVELLIECGSRIDCVDKFNKPIILLPILYDYHSILELLLKIDKNKIGLSIVNQYDSNMKTPLMYAIENKNLKSINLLLQYNANPNILDSDDKNSLFYAINTKQENIIKLILPKINNINNLSILGETCLHVACLINMPKINLLLDNNININQQNYKNEYTALHIAILLQNYDIINILLNNKNINVNIQTNIGNTALHLAMLKYNKEIVSMLKNNKNINYNLWNIDSEIPLHILLKNKMDIYNDILIESNLLIKDSDGNTCLYLLFQNYDWTKYKNILEHKQLNPFIYNNKSIFDFGNKTDIMNLIYTSYFNNLKLHKNKWIAKWENMCSTETTMSNKCLDEIKSHIKKTNVSYPINQKFDLQLNNNSCSCSYFGDNLDLNIGLLELQKKFKSITIMFNKSQQLYYDDNEIIWMDNKLKVPKHLKQTFETCSSYFVILIGIVLKQSNHTNILLYDKSNNTIERFEPHGSTYPINYNYNPGLLDDQLKLLFNSFKTVEYITPGDYLPKIGFQSFDSCEYKCKYINDPLGFCSVWCIWYIDMRLSYKISRDALVNMLILHIKEHNISFKQLIREYSYNIITIRNKLLSCVNLNINKWSTENYSDEEYNNLIAKINSYYII